MRTISSHSWFGLSFLLLAGCADPSGGPHGPGPQLVALEAGGHGTCALTEGGALFCWGNALPGLGAEPELVSGALTLKEMTVANGWGGAVCATAEGGSTYCGGAVADQWDIYRSYDGFQVDSIPFHGVTAGDGHACAIGADSAAYCWGSSLAGKRGEGASTEQAPLLTPNQVVGGLKFTALAAAQLHTCGLTSTANVYCWGVGERLGDTLGVSSSEECWFWSTCAWAPIPVRALGSVRSLAVGERESCATLYTGAVWCWSPEPDGADWKVGFPHLVALPEAASEVAIGGVFSCALGHSGKVYCWGDPGPWRGNPGLGTPTQVTTSLRFRSITAGGYHVCGIEIDETPYCWGLNDQGQLGNGSTSESSIPVPVALPPAES